MQSPNTASRVNLCLRRAATLLAENSSQSRNLHVTSANIQKTTPSYQRTDPNVIAKAGAQLRQQVAKDGLRTFIEKVTAKPKEARMWLKYFKSLAVWDRGQAFCVLHITEDVFYNIKILETFAWSTAFLMQNGMRPVIVFGTQRGRKENMQDVENKLDVLGSRLQKLLQQYGGESAFFTACNQILRFDDQRRLCIDQEVMSETLESNVIPIVTNFLSDASAELKFRVMDPIRVAEVVAQATRPLKMMLLSSEKGIQDVDGKIVSDIILPSDLPNVQNNTWYKGDARNKRRPQQSAEIATEIERVGKLLESLPSESSVILTSADTVIQELFTHHGSGTMIKRSEKVISFDSLGDVDLVELGNLISESFKQPLPDTFFHDIRHQVDRVYITEGYTAAAIILHDAALGVPYLDKFAVRTSAQGLGISAQVWTEVVKDYKQLFWRSRATNHSANNWYNSVCQGSWKDNQWIVYWYGMPSCKEVFALIDYALKRESTFGNFSPEPELGRSSPAAGQKRKNYESVKESKPSSHENFQSDSSKIVEHVPGIAIPAALA